MEPLPLALAVVALAIVLAYALHRRKARRAAGPSVLIESLDVADEWHRVPLPPGAVPGEDVAKIKEFLTAATMEELKRYLYETLPAAGWQLGDRLATGFFYFRGDARLTVLVQTTGSPDLRSRVRLTVSKRSSPSSRRL